jgi:flagellar export protein FliJ
MAFHFTLEQVLRVRESIERREELVLQRAEMEVARVRRRIEELTELLASIDRRREESLKKPLKAYELQGMDAEMNAATDARLALLGTLKTVEELRDAQLTVYRTAHNGRQMLTDLEEEKRMEYEKEQTRAQQKRLDDLFAARIQRR